VGTFQGLKKTVSHTRYDPGLERFGLTPKDIPRVFLSHLHNDHGLNIGMLSYSNRPGGLPMGFPASSEWYGKKTRTRAA
jgi:ribonuclease BN (tRNA processing enzyme)